jgi:RHS repeat-associated protein
MSKKPKTAHGFHSNASGLTFRSASHSQECRNSNTEQHESNELPRGLPLPIRWGEGLRERGSIHWQYQTKYVYDDENRLIQWFHYQVSPASRSTGDQRTDFVYDGLGRLRKRLEYSLTCPGGGEENLAQPGGAQTDSGGGGDGCLWSVPNETWYIYDGWRVIQERDGNNTPTVSYTRGTDLSGSLESAGGIGGLLARSSGYSGGNWTTHNFYFADGNGNITYMLNSSQAMVASYRYDPFGNMISSSGTLANANVYRFSTKEIHANSGMYYYLFRFYDPNLQRWINRDPILEWGGINLYSALFNSPPMFLDPFGLTDFPCTFIGPLRPGDRYVIVINTGMTRGDPRNPDANNIVEPNLLGHQPTNGSVTVGVNDPQNTGVYGPSNIYIITISPIQLIPPTQPPSSSTNPPFRLLSQPK